MRRFLAAFLFFVLPGLTHAACHAVSPAGAGAKTGADWNNSYAGLPATLVRGDIYYLADGSYATRSFSTAASGTTTIEIRKAQSYDTGSGCSPSIAAGWNTGTMGSAQAVFGSVITVSGPYFIFNGNGTTTAPGCGGAITGTQSVSAAPPTPTDCGIKIVNSTSGLPGGMAPSGAHGTFEYIEELGSGVNQNDEVFAPGTSFLLIKHAYMHYSGCVYIQDVGSNSTVDHSYFWGTEVNGGSACHGQADYIIGGENNGVRSNNAYRDITGTAIWTLGTSGTVTGWIFYNNLIYFSTPNQTFGGLSDAALDCINGVQCQGFIYVQNTIVNCTKGSGGFGPECGVGWGDSASGGSVTIENNLYYANPGGIALTTHGTTVVEDYNSFLNTSGFGSGAHDVHLTSGSPNPLVNWPQGNFNLASENSNWNNRLALGSPYTLDVNGNTFTSDRGAYQFISGTPAAVTLSPTSLAFGNQTAGVASAPRVVTLTNSGGSILTISGITITGTNPADFSQTNNCGASVNAGGSCSISVVFTPASAASFSASVSIADNASGSPQTVPLTGTGVAATAGISFAPTSLAFGNQQVAVASAPLSTTVTNTGSATLTITAVTITGTNAADFTRTTTCTSVAPAGTCTISVTFTPGATGARSASVSVSDNAAGSPQTVPLTGTGTAAAVGLSPASLAFGNQTQGTTSAAQTTTLTNTGSATLTISSITITGTNAADFAQTNNCGASVAVGGSCVITVRFTPSATGARSASVSVADNASGSPQTVPLTGTGVAAVAGISFSPMTLAFGNQQIAVSSSPLSTTVTNSGSATLTITAVTITGTNASDFTRTTTCTSVAPAGTCSITVTFKPAATGSRTANVSVTDNAAGSPQSIPLTGTGTAATVGLTPVGLNFSLDIYGGQPNVSCTATGYFHTQKIGSRWWFCDPLGHGFTSTGVGNIEQNGNPTLDCASNNTFPIYAAKYGTTAAWQTASVQRMLGWGFNTIGQDSSFSTAAGLLATPFIYEDRPAQYAMLNTDNYLPEPIKDEINGVNPTYYTGYFGSPLADVFDAKLATWWNDQLASSQPGIVKIRSNNPYILAIFTDDTDYFWGAGAGPDFLSLPGGHNNSNLGFITLLTSPVQTFAIKSSFSNTPYLYQQTQVYSKAQALNPGTCSIASPCSLRDYLKNKYGTIAALNTSWGSTYTTFDSSGTQVTGEAVGTGNGSQTTFTYTLAHTPVSPYSVEISIAGTAEIGDCPWFKVNSDCITGTSNTGTLASPTASYLTQSTSTINYSTGAITLNFVTAPANGAAITVSYIYAGWMAGGTGLMDEYGSNTSWVGTNSYCVEGANPSYPTYFSCTGAGGYNPVPNANANLGADFDGWVAQFSAEYFKTMRTGLKAVSSLPYFGADNIGSYDVPPNSNFMVGMAPYVDGAFVSMTVTSQSAPEFTAIYDYTTQYLGDLPLMNISYLVAQANSSYYCITPSPGNPRNFSTQALRGQAWQSNLASLLTTPSYNNDFPLVGFNFWAWQDTQNANLGLVSLHDNAYDGNEDQTATVTCSPGYTSLTTCGGEAGTITNYGNALTYITAGNLLTYVNSTGTPVGTPSAGQAITLTNTGSAPLSISGFSFTGVNPSDFSQTNNCGSSVAVGGSCMITVVFTPGAAGLRGASLNIADSASGSPQMVFMQGIGFTPAAAISISPSSLSLTFATQTVGTPSNAQAIIVTNTGTAAITFSSISITGANAGDYGQTNTCGASLAVNSSCSILVTFMPTTSGTRTANVSIADNVAGSPQTVTLSGTGIVGPLVAPDPGMFAFLR